MLVADSVIEFPASFYQQLRYADGSLVPPSVSGCLKNSPEDFQVTEELGFACSGQGEHVWLDITKTNTSTIAVAKLLANLAGVKVRDIGYSGLKDVQAITRQWFSVWLPGVTPANWPDWQSLQNDQLSINQAVLHDKKLKRGTHIANRFLIRVNDVVGDISDFEQRLKIIQRDGAPNYFGPQRFGYEASNLNQLEVIFRDGKRVKQRQKRSLLFSAARSWLFNTVLSQRLQQANWLQVQSNEPLNLNGSRQYFVSTDTAVDQQRLDQHDVHTSGPLWGRGREKLLADCDLSLFEQQAMQEYQHWQTGLEKAGLEYARRPLRLLPKALGYRLSEHSIEIEFTLPRGQYATALLRELVQEAGQ